MSCLLYLIEYPCLIVIYCVILNRIMHHIFSKPVYDLNVIEIYHDSTGGATWNIRNFICLYGYLHIFEGREERHLEVVAGFRYCVKEGSSSEVDPHMAFLDNVETTLYKNQWENEGYCDNKGEIVCHSELILLYS